ncbi:uncharacterized protein LOC143071092 isoform X2 [Mytilus galloprovincialis]|uniref:uncharacterized protein LOC143071092 isoform X2 n=1 Tax=Mytilus galloprovincialis TaxID=29158 RepID=UPI003F7CB92A
MMPLVYKHITYHAVFVSSDSYVANIIEDPADTPMDESSDDDINKGSDDIKNIENQKYLPVFVDDEVYQDKLKLAIVLMPFIILILSITTTTFVRKDDEISLSASEISGCSIPFHGEILRLSRQLENISVLLMNEHVSVEAHGKNIKQQRKTHTCVCDQLNGELKRLKEKVQLLNSSKDNKDTIKTDKDVYTPRQRRNINELAFLSSSHYRLAYGNRCFTGHTDYIDVIFKLNLFHPNVNDNGTLLFEFGLASTVEYLVKDVYDNQMLTVKAFRCKHAFGICLEVTDEISSKIDVSVFKQTPEWIQGHITMGLQSSRFMLMSENQNIYIGSKLNMSRGLEVWPVFGIYNSHLISMSIKIHSNNLISFNRTSLDPHLFISDDNNTIANWYLQFEQIQTLSLENVYMYIEKAFFVIMPLMYLLRGED